MTTITFGAVIRRSVLSGALAGICAAIFVGLVAKGSIDEAIAIEESAIAIEGSAVPDSAVTLTHTDLTHADDNHAHGTGEALFTRDQQVIGGLAAALIYGIITGLVFGTVFALVRHKLTLSDDTRRVLLLASVAYITTALLPALKYPANPPAVGDPSTVNERTVLYLTFVGICIVLAVAVGMIYTQLKGRFDRSSAVVLASVAAVVGGVVIFSVWPASPDKVPTNFPPQLLWDFRINSLTTLAIIWLTLGLAMGWMNSTRT